MKRSILAAVLFLSFAVCFPRQPQRIDLEFPTLASLEYLKLNNDEYLTYGIPLGIKAVIFNENSLNGMEIGFNFYFNLGMGINNGNHTREISVFEYNNSLTSFDFYIGALFNLYREHRLSVPFSIGLRVNFVFNDYIYDVPISYRPPYGFITISQNTEVDYSAIVYGIGFNIGMQAYFNRRESVYIFLKLYGAIDFLVSYFKISKIPGHDEGYADRNTQFAFGFMANPQIGIGFRVQ
ncbi:MAG: hypothetical protein FWC01_00160 [Treponema sp.]|nr:hypothetical protein [Treponema sp.]MCL2236667.1 hypothetical protein [Treponema sp.]